MKKLFLIILAFAFLLAGCKMNSGASSENDTGAPSKISITGAKGVYLTSSSSSTASSSRSLVSGRSVISIATSSLCCVKATGDTAAATFTDEDDNVIDVTITKAAQLDDDYILLTYTYTDSESVTQTVTSSLNVSSGTLHELSVTPDNWDRIFARGTIAWFEYGGSIYKCVLSSGTCTVISSSAETYANDGTSRDLSDNGVTASWSSDAWIFANTGSDVFVFDGSYQSFQAQAITSAGVKSDFGYQNEAYTMFEWEPSNSEFGATHALYDNDSGEMYVLRCGRIYDNDITKSAGQTETGGMAIRVYHETFDADSSGDVLTLATTPVYAIKRTDDCESYNIMYVGYHYNLQKSVLGTSEKTYTFDTSSAYVSDTSSVPIDHTRKDGTDYDYYIANWLYSGSAVYAGPDDDTDEIDIMEFKTGTVTIKTLVSGTGVKSWTVVGDVLFYTNTSGQTYKAAVDTSTCTCATPTYYSDTEVIGITQ